MKKLLFGLIATVMFSFVGNAQTESSKPRNGRSELCVSVVIITYCVSWDWSIANQPSNSELSKSKVFESTIAKSEIINDAKSPFLVISGFSSILEGLVVDGPRKEIEKGKFTVAGKYTIKSGRFTVPIEN